MKKTLFFSLLMLTLSGYSQTVTFDWAKQMGGTSIDEGHSISVDASGNIYTTGYFKDEIDFDPGVGVYNLTSNGSDDIFIQKLDGSGNFLWVKQMGGVYYDDGRSIAVDASSNIYTTGYFSGTVDFDPGAGISNLISTGGHDIYIQKLDGNGNFLWVKQMQGPGYDIGHSIAVDASGNVYTTGTFKDTVDFDPGAGVYNLYSNGYEDIFIQKLDANGNLLWAKKMGGTGNDYGESIAIDASGNVYTTGSFWGTVDFNSGTGVHNLSSNGMNDIFIQKLDENGSFLWVKQMGGVDYDYGTAIIVDASSNVYSIGGFNLTADFNPGTGLNNLTSNGDNDIYIQKLDVNGNFVWVKQVGGVGFDVGNSIAFDDFGNIYTTGSFQYAVDFNPGSVAYYLSSNGGSDIFNQALDANGDFLWAKQVGGLDRDRGNSVTVDAYGNIYTTGIFTATVDFNPGAGLSNLTSNGGRDIFIQKLNQSGIGILEDDFGTEFKLYPNPANGFFTIDLGKPYDATITISDLTGKIILSKLVENSQRINLKLEEPAGVYLLIVESAEKKAVVKLVKE